MDNALREFKDAKMTPTSARNRRKLCRGSFVTEWRRQETQNENRHDGGDEVISLHDHAMC